MSSFDHLLQNSNEKIFIQAIDQYFNDRSANEQERERTDSIDQDLHLDNESYAFDTEIQNLNVKFCQSLYDEFKDESTEEESEEGNQSLKESVDEEAKQKGEKRISIGEYLKEGIYDSEHIRAYRNEMIKRYSEHVVMCVAWMKQAFVMEMMMKVKCNAMARINGSSNQQGAHKV